MHIYSYYTCIRAYVHTPVKRYYIIYVLVHTGVS